MDSRKERPKFNWWENLTCKLISDDRIETVNTFDTFNFCINLIISHEKHAVTSDKSILYISNWVQFVKIIDCNIQNLFRFIDSFTLYSQIGKSNTKIIVISIIPRRLNRIARNKKSLFGSPYLNLVIFYVRIDILLFYFSIFTCAANK
jgi:hypothetical protein